MFGVVAGDTIEATVRRKPISCGEKKSVIVAAYQRQNAHKSVKALVIKTVFKAQQKQ